MADEESVVESSVTVRLAALARLYADPVAQAEIEQALNVDDATEQYRKRIPRSERVTQDQRSEALTPAERK